jgi:hypothetical protein
VRQMQGGTGQASEADIAALATALIMQSHGAVVAEADVNELERAVLALVKASGCSGATHCAIATNR